MLDILNFTILSCLKALSCALFPAFLFGAQLVARCLRAVQQVREQLASEFSSERESLLREVHLTQQQQQEDLSQAQKGTVTYMTHVHLG